MRQLSHTPAQGCIIACISLSLLYVYRYTLDVMLSAHDTDTLFAWSIRSDTLCVSVSLFIRGSTFGVPFLAPHGISTSELSAHLCPDNACGVPPVCGGSDILTTSIDRRHSLQMRGSHLNFISKTRFSSYEFSRGCNPIGVTFETNHLKHGIPIAGSTNDGTIIDPKMHRHDLKLGQGKGIHTSGWGAI